MDFLTPDKIRLLLIFVVPGVVILYARRQFVNNRRLSISEAVPSSVAISFFYQALAWPMTALLLQKSADGWLLGLIWVVHLFLGPMVVGFFLGLNARQGWVRWLLNKIKINIGHPVDSAWDWRFGGCEECWVLAVLKDGTTWAGHLGDGSFMSTDPEERDIFIQHVFEIGADKVWKPRDSGVWIAHGELQSLEFWPLNKGD